MAKVNLRLTDNEKVALDKAAKKEFRTLHQQARWFVVSALRDGGELDDEVKHMGFQTKEGDNG